MEELETHVAARGSGRSQAAAHEAGALLQT